MINLIPSSHYRVIAVHRDQEGRAINVEARINENKFTGSELKRIIAIHPRDTEATADTITLTYSDEVAKNKSEVYCATVRRVK